MKGEKFSLYKNIKSLCKEIYQSIKYNDSYNLNNCSNSFRDINIALKDKFTNNLITQMGGHNQNIEELKKSIIQKIQTINNLKGGGISEDNAGLKQEIIDKIKRLEIKDMKDSLKLIEKTLSQVLIFIETYKKKEPILIENTIILETNNNLINFNQLRKILFKNILF
jgi:hypothetical protein